ncbi:MAG: proteasome assembly chaperone family protein [Acidilobus sp.]
MQGLPLAAYEEEILGYNFIEYGDLGRPRFLVLGLPDAGLVGPIASGHLVRTLGMLDALGVESYGYLPPAAVVLGGSVKYPLRMYVKGELAVFVTEITPVASGIVPLSIAIVEFARKRGVQYLVGLSGIGNPTRTESQPQLYWIATTPDAEKLASSLDGVAKRFPDGLIVGPYATILKESVKRGVNTLLLLSDSYVDIPDPEAAALIIDGLSRMTGVKVDTTQLLQEAETLRLRLQGMAREARDTLAKMGKGYEYRAPLIYS